MKTPLILVDGADITLFQSAAELERYVEAPDVGRYKIFDADGNSLTLSASQQVFGSGKIKVHALGPVHVVGADPPQRAEQELRILLSGFLSRVGHPPISGNSDLADLLDQVRLVVGWS